MAHLCMNRTRMENGSLWRTTAREEPELPSAVPGSAAPDLPHGPVAEPDVLKFPEEVRDSDV